MFTDYQTKSGRLKKDKKGKDSDVLYMTGVPPTNPFRIVDDFNLADSDDFFGFSENESPKVRMIWKVAIILLVAYFAWYIFQALSFIAQPAPVATSTQSVVDYSNLKPLPQMNWNFTPINERMEN